jgi:hypothetical protein
MILLLEPSIVASTYNTVKADYHLICLLVRKYTIYRGIPVDPRLLTEKNDFGGGFVQGVALNSKRAEDSSPVPIDNTNQSVKEFELPSSVVKISELTAASSNFGTAADAQTKVNLTKLVES